MSLSSRQDLIARLRRGKKSREEFVDSHLSKGLAYQLRTTREQLGWSQERLAREAGMDQHAISRLESAGYGKPTVTTLKRLAAALDVGLVVRLIPFSELVDWVSGTPRMNPGLTRETLAVESFAAEEARGVFIESSSLPRQGSDSLRSGLRDRSSANDYVGRVAA